MSKDDYWYSFNWFSPFVFLSYSWEYVFILYLIPTIPLLFFLRWIFYLQYNPKIEVAYFSEHIKRNIWTLLRFIPNLLMSFVIVLLIIVAARPQKANQVIEQKSEGIDIILALDISKSMMIEDFKPNRLEVSKKVAQTFVEGRPFDRIGLVIFSGDAYTLSPLTTDHNVLKTYLSEINNQYIASEGTAIGNAIAICTNRLRESTGKSKVIVLISDGDNTAGSLDPNTASQLAQNFNIKIYSVLVGQEGKVPYRKNAISPLEYVENTINEATLRKIAKIGEGSFFRASSSQALIEVFNKIDQYEKTEIKENYYLITRDYYRPYLLWSIIILTVWVLLKSTFVTNALQD